MSASLRDLEDKLMTQLVFFNKRRIFFETAGCFSLKSYSNFYFCLSLVVFKTRWVLVLTCSSILFASSVARVDVTLCAVNTASLAFALALYVSLIHSLWNLMDASSVTLRALLVGTGGRTCRS